MLGMGSTGDGAQVAEGSCRVGIDRGDPSFGQTRVPLLQSPPPLFDGHLFHRIGIANGQIFPVPHSNGAGEAHFGIKQTVFRRGGSKQDFPETLSVECFLCKRNACEFEDGRGEIDIAHKRVAAGTAREASFAPDDARILEAALVERAFGVRDVPAPVWGWTTPGAKVTVSLAGSRAEAVADANGRWLAKIGPLPAGGPHILSVSGPQRATFSDILVGDVWLCSGQSNMYMKVKDAEHGEQEAASATLPQLRMLAIRARPAGEPRTTFAEPVAWQVASPTTVKDFSAVAFFFARQLQQELNIPIGVIQTSDGGTSIEAWSSAEALLSVPGGDRDLADLNEWKELVIEWAKYDAEPAVYKKLMADWYLANDPGSADGLGWAEPTLDDSDWKTMALPGRWSERGLPGFSGVVWFRREFDLPEALDGKDTVLSLGPLDRRDTVWVNGTKVGESDSNGGPRNYRVAGKLLQKSDNLVAVRVLGDSGFVGKADQLKLVGEPINASAAPSLSLSGEWRYKESVSLKKATRVPSLRSGNPNIPSALYNGAIAPLAPFAIKGVVWYQGESNTNNPHKYRQSLPALITDWRARFAVGDFPFLIVQLPGFGVTHASAWAQFRDVQAAIARSVPNCGLAVTIDLGEDNNVHPLNKLDVGRRLGLVAQNFVYKQPVASSGPVYASMQVDGAAIRVCLQHADGLAARGGGSLRGFAIAGEDKRFVSAEAVIEQNSVVVRSPLVAKPVAVRYAWDDTLAANLINAAGLPAGPFRSDDW